MPTVLLILAISFWCGPGLVCDEAVSRRDDPPTDVPPHPYSSNLTPTWREAQIVALKWGHRKQKT